MTPDDAHDASAPKPIRRLEESLVNKIAAGEVGGGGQVEDDVLTRLRCRSFIVQHPH